MDFNRKNIKKLRGLILFTGLVSLLVIYIKEAMGVVLFVWGIMQPFIVGGAIAFVLNIPLKGVERLLFRNKEGTKLERIKRPVSIVISTVFVLLILVFVTLTVIPQLTRTIIELGNKIPRFMQDAFVYLENAFSSNPQLLAVLEEFDYTRINWDSVLNGVVEFMRNGLGSMVTSTFTVAGSIISGVANTCIALVFSFYVLSQKEKLGEQARRILKAYGPRKAADRITQVASLLHRNFTSFITGQCLEAVILGTMFVVTMLIFRLPYATLVGVLIGFTALIPIVGAFIGCFVGAFLILVDDPLKALVFVILFLVLQQIEGNLIYPHVVGSSVGLPSIWVLLAVTVGGSLMGILGMLIFIPILSTAYALLREDVNSRNAVKAAEMPEPPGPQPEQQKKTSD